MTDHGLPPWPGRAALFLDFDGTLLEIADEPHLVAPSARLRALLPALAPATHGAIALVSGRPIAEIDRLLAPHRFAAAGIHGLERRDTAGELHCKAADDAAFRALRAVLGPFALRYTGLLLEDKGHTLALHYRQRPDLAAEVTTFVGDIERSLPPELEILPGRMVFEIKPRGTDKGRAIAAFMREPPFLGRTAVFVGDDVTDEAGFAAVNARGGVSVKVGDGATAAHWRLAGVSAVIEWLERCTARHTSAAEASVE